MGSLQTWYVNNVLKKVVLEIIYDLSDAYLLV